MKWTKWYTVGIVIIILLAAIGVAFLLLGKPSISKVHIDSDTELLDQAKKYGWSGDGSIGDPIRITGLKLNVTGIAPCIYIGNTTKHMVIAQCDLTMNYDDPGMLNGAGNIILFNVQNATIEDNSISSGSSGIELKQCKNDVIRNNTINSNSGFTSLFSDNNTITGNIFQTIEFSSNQMTSSNDNRFDNNTFHAVEGTGLVVAGSDRNSFSYNIFTGTTIGPGSTRGMTGLVLSDSSENQFDHNQMNGGGYFGIGMSMVGSNSNNIELNSIIGPHGVYMTESIGNVIYKNDITGSHFSIIYLSSSYGNTIDGNNMVGWNTDAGIFVDEANNNSITGNKIVGQQYSNYLIKMQGSQGNLVTHNDLISQRDMSLLPDPKPKLAFDDSGLNSWNDTTQGNYWGDWTIPDVNVDKIVDLPYLLDGGAGATDWYPSAVPYFTGL